MPFDGKVNGLDWHLHAAAAGPLSNVYEMRIFRKHVFVMMEFSSVVLGFFCFRIDEPIPEFP